MSRPSQSSAVRRGPCGPGRPSCRVRWASAARAYVEADAALLAPLGDASAREIPKGNQRLPGREKGIVLGVAR